MNLTILGIVGVLVLVALIFFGVNIGMAMAAVGFVGFALCTDIPTAFGLFRTVPFTNSASYSLSVIPLFVLMGQFAYHSGISQGLFDACERLMGKMRGGLCAATVATAAGFSAICGSAPATAATMSTLALGPMRRAKYDDSLSTGCLASGGTLGILIPPSTAFVVYGITANQSIGRLFAAGILPGILLAVAFVVAIQVVCIRNPKLAPPGETNYTVREKLQGLLGAIPILLLFAVVIGGIFTGWFTANEAAGVGAMLGLVFMAIKRRLSVKSLIQALYESVKITAMIYIIFIGAYIFGYFVTITMIPTTLANFVAGLNVHPILVLLVILAIYAFLGCIMDAMAMILLTVPIFMPIIEGLGYDLVWFGVVVVLVMQIGMMTPPVGMNVYVIAGVARDVPMSKIFKGVIPFVIAALVVVLFVILVPNFSLWLPNMIYS